MHADLSDSIQEIVFFFRANLNNIVKVQKYKCK